MRLSLFEDQSNRIPVKNFSRPEGFGRYYAFTYTSSLA
jgi:hypothetical protein